MRPHTRQLKDIRAERRLLWQTACVRQQSQRSRPMLSVTALPRVLRTLFTTTANELARETGFVQRARKLDGAHFAQTLVLGYLSAAAAALSQLQHTAATTGPAVSRQAIAQRSTEAAATFLQRLLEAAMTQTFAAARVPPALLARFGALTIGDSTIIALPPALAARWPGRGGSTPTSGAAALQLQVRWELVQGALDTLELRTGRASDQTAAQQTTLPPPDALDLKDEGYFCVAALRTLVTAGRHFLRRPLPHLTVTTADGQRWSVLRYLTVHAGRTL